MNNQRIFARSILLAVLLFGCYSFLWAQTQQLRPILQLQQDFESGRINAETAAVEQYRLLYEHKDLSTAQKREIIKCATPANIFLQQHQDKLSAPALYEIEKLREKSSKSSYKQIQESYITASGLFEIIYTTSGEDSVSIVDDNENGVPDYVEWVGEAADSSYRHQVHNIGFIDPIPDGMLYEIRLENMGFYGETRSYSNAEFRPLTYIRVENDFLGFPLNTDPEGHQKGAIKATVAHEFKHAIQYVQNRWRAPSGNPSWSEMDATLMEEVVYDDVNDYYNYIKNGLNSTTPDNNSVFAIPDKSVPGSYYFVTWMIYYTEAFGNDIWRQVWEVIGDENLIGIDEALAVVLPENFAEFETAFVQNYLWHFASGSRAGDNTYGFEEKDEYPNVLLEDTFEGVPESEVELEKLEHLAARYFEVIPSPDDQGFIEIALDFDSTMVGLGLLFYMNSGEINEIIVTGEDKAQVFYPSEFEWAEISRLGVIVANPNLTESIDSLTLTFGKEGKQVTIRDPDYAELPERIRVHQNYPNPFNTGTTIQFEIPQTSYVQLEIYDINGRRLQTLVNENRRFGRYTEHFDGAGYASGVYLYRLRIGDEVFVKKMALIK